jgi:hypothetical protein
MTWKEMESRWRSGFGWMMLIILPLPLQMEAQMDCGNMIMKGSRTNIIGFLTKPDIETITGISTARKEQYIGEAIS